MVNITDKKGMEKDLGDMNERFKNILNDLYSRKKERIFQLKLIELNKICSRLESNIDKMISIIEKDKIEKEFTRLFYESRDEIINEEIHLSVGKSG